MLYAYRSLLTEWKLEYTLLQRQQTFHFKKKKEWKEMRHTTLVKIFLKKK